MNIFRYDELLSSLSDYVDLFIIIYDFLKYSISDFNNDFNNDSTDHFQRSTAFSCHNQWYQKHSNKVVVLKNRMEKAVMELFLVDKYDYHLTSNVIN